MLMALLAATCAFLFGSSSISSAIEDLPRWSLSNENRQSPPSSRIDLVLCWRSDASRGSSSCPDVDLKVVVDDSFHKLGLGRPVGILSAAAPPST
mmetsp:Transcript_62263/g.196591  ORF Transcript_62263/g.196591 Transcript_62263/m.196591 type:complete len:95 (-) Transcript_62263:7-291(-)